MTEIRSPAERRRRLHPGGPFAAASTCRPWMRSSTRTPNRVGSGSRTRDAQVAWVRSASRSARGHSRPALARCERTNASVPTSATTAAPKTSSPPVDRPIESPLDGRRSIRPASVTTTTPTISTTAVVREPGPPNRAPPMAARPTSNRARSDAGFTPELSNGARPAWRRRCPGSRAVR